MSNNLDKSLKEIQSQIRCCSYHMEDKEFRDEIKQVFIDNNWIKIPQAYKDKHDQLMIDGEIAMTRAEWERQAIKDGWHKECPPKVTDGTLYPLIWAGANGYKTGQEWYDRFEKEFKYSVVTAEGVRVLKGAMSAAKKAAGLE